MKRESVTRAAESRPDQPFGDCKHAALQHMGSIQAHGSLLAIHAESQHIEYCSANSAGLLGIEAEELCGQTGTQWFADRWPAMLRLASQDGTLESPRL